MDWPPPVRFEHYGSSWDHLNKEQNKRRQNRRKALKVLPGKPGELFLKITEITIELA